MKSFKVLAVILFMASTLSNCSSPVSDATRELASVQIRDYQGEKLSSITDFRENSINGPQYIDINKYKLSITGLVNTPLSFTYEDVIGRHQNYTKLITMNCVEGWSVKLVWDGVLVKDLINDAGIKPEAKAIIFHAYDGYTTSLPLQYVLDKNLLLSYKMNGVTLPPERGYPFQLAAEDKWGYKWIKWITEIELSDNTNYKGFWESNGYSNDGSLEKPFFDR